MQPCNSFRAQLTNRHRHRPTPPRCPPCRPLGCRGRLKESPWAEGSAARNSSRADHPAPSLAYPSALDKESALPGPRRGILKAAEAGAEVCAAAVGDATHDLAHEWPDLGAVPRQGLGKVRQGPPCGRTPRPARQSRPERPPTPRRPRKEQRQMPQQRGPLRPR